MKTREKILQTALKLFNGKGLSQVTLRSIAAEMGISQGNLNYHFRKRKDIIEALYFELVEKMDQGMVQMVSAEPDMGLLFRSNLFLFERLYAYRFLMLDFVQVMREHPNICEHYQRLQTGRTLQFAALVQLFQQKGWIRVAEFEEEYERLYQRMNIMGDFWISFGEIAGGELDKKKVLHFSILLAESMYPYLTERGKGEFSRAKMELLHQK